MPTITEQDTPTFASTPKEAAAAPLVPDFNFEAVQDQEAPEPLVPNFDWSTVPTDSQTDTVTALKGAMLLAEKEDPEKKAKAMALADESGLPVSLVQRNLDRLEREKRFVDYGFDDLQKKNPGLTTWLQDPNNAAVAKDDIPAQKEIEDSIQEHSLLSTAYRRFGAAYNQNLATIAKIPATALDLLSIPGNAIEKYVMGNPDGQYRAPESARNNPVAQYFQEQAKAYTPTADEAALDSPDFQKELFQGNFAKAGRSLFLGIIDQVPQLATTIGVGIATGGVGSAAAFGGLSQATGVLDENEGKGKDPLALQTDAALQGIAEGVFEGLEGFGSLSVMKNIFKQTASRYGKSAAVEVAKGFAKEILTAGGKNAAEEYVTGVAQDLADYFTGVDTDKIKDTFRRNLNNAAIGFGSGVLLEGPGAISAGVHEGSVVREAEQAKAFYMALGDKVAATKLKSRLPQAQQAVLAEMTKNGPVENIYLSPEAVETLFQKKGESLPEQLQKLGLLKQYEEAKETGIDMKIPTAEFATKVAGTEYQALLADDIKFQPDAKSVNEVKAERAETQAQLEEQAKAAEAAAALEATTATGAPSKSEASVDQIKTQITETLTNLGYSKTEAEANAELFSSRYRNRSEILGVDPQELLNRYPVAIQNAETTTTPEGQTLSQEKTAENTFFQDKPTNVLGSITLGETKALIQLASTKDASTFQHESAHLFLREIAADTKELRARESSSLTERQKKFLSDADAILEELGVKSFDEIQSEQHEKFAESFEQYLLEGKSPSQRLKRVFDQFKKWLKKLYPLLNRANLNPRLRGIFDRLVATDAEIDAAMQMQNRTALDDSVNHYELTGDAAEIYRRAVEKDRAAAERALLKKLMADMTVEEKQAYKADLKRVKESVTADIEGDQIYNTISILKNGTLADGSPIEGEEGGFPIKLSREEIKSTYGEEILKGLPSGIFDKEAGVPAEMAASLLGYKTGEELLKAISNQPSMKEAIQKEVSERMRELYPKLFESPEALEVSAMDAIHLDSRADVLRQQMNQLVSLSNGAQNEAIRKIVRRTPPSTEVKAKAADIIGALKVGAIKPYIYQRAEAKWAKEAGRHLAAKRFAEAFEAKKKEYLNFELFRAAVEANKIQEKTIQKFKRIAQLSDEDAAKTRDTNMLNAAKAVIANYGLGTKKTKTADQYLNPIKEYDTEAYASLKALIDNLQPLPQNYQELTYGQFLEVKQAVEAMYSLSRSMNQIEIDGKKISKKDAVDQLIQGIQAIAEPGQKKKYAESASNITKLKNFGGAAQSWLRRMESWVDAADQGNILGPFRKFLYQTAKESTDQYRLEKGKYLKRIEEILQPVFKGVPLKAIVADELTNSAGEAYRFRGKHELMGALLHVGNESNKAKLLLGYEWGSRLEDGSLDTSKWDRFIDRMQREGVIQKADWDAIQKVWDLFEELKPMAQREHKKRYGYYFSEITSNEFETPFGKYKGGYAPAKIDSNHYTRVEILEDKFLLERLNNSGAWPSAGRGFTKSRDEQFAAPLLLDIRGITGHVDSVLKFSYLQNPANDVARLLFDRRFSEAMKALDPTVVDEMMKPYIQRLATQKVSDPLKSKFGRGLDTAARYLRSNTGLQFLALNIINAAQNFTGIGPASLKVPYSYLRNSFFEYARSPKAFVKNISELSVFMKNRLDDGATETATHIHDLVLNPGLYQSSKEGVKKIGRFLQAATQNYLDIVVWSGAYDHALDQGFDEKTAIRSADSAVRLTQSSNHAEDISRIEAGPDVAKIFTMFSTYFNTIGNLNATEGKKALRQKGMTAKAQMLLKVYIGGFLIPAVGSEILRRALSGRGIDANDDDSYLDDFFDIFFGSQARFGSAMIPLAGSFINFAANKFNKNTFDDKLDISPIASQAQSAASAPFDVARILQKGEVKKQDVRDILTLLGLVTNQPLLPLSKPLGYLIDLKDRKIKQPTGPIDFARGLATGMGDRTKK